MKIGKRGQSSIIDALLFMLICASASSLMLYTIGIYSENTTKELAIINNFEFEKATLISLHYVKDIDGDFFWIKMQDKLTKDPSYITSYLTNEMEPEFNTILSNSPSAKTIIEIENESNSYTIYCYNFSSFGLSCFSSKPTGYNGTTFASSTQIYDSNGNKWKIKLEAFY